MNTLENKNAIFPKGEKTSPDYFTGTAWLKMLEAEMKNVNIPGASDVNLLVPKLCLGTYITEALLQLNEQQGRSQAELGNDVNHFSSSAAFFHLT